MRGLVQLSRASREAIPLQSLYDPGLDLQLTSKREGPGLKFIPIPVRGADNISLADFHIHGVVWRI
jgi:hypothetical protein